MYISPSITVFWDLFVKSAFSSQGESCFLLGLIAYFGQTFTMVRLIQIRRGTERRVAVVEEPRVRLLAAGAGSVYAVALEAMAQGKKLADLVREKATDETLDYEAIYAGQSPWKLLPPLDHPDEPARCLVSGTGDRKSVV